MITVLCFCGFFAFFVLVATAWILLTILLGGEDFDDDY